jgi:hypothetical protein
VRWPCNLVKRYGFDAPFVPWLFWAEPADARKVRHVRHSAREALLPHARRRQCYDDARVELGGLKAELPGAHDTLMTLAADESTYQTGLTGNLCEVARIKLEVCGIESLLDLEAFTTRLVISPSITASCMTTPTRRAPVRSHSRNSAPCRAPYA